MKFTSLEPSVMIAKGKTSFATMTHGCQAVIMDKFWFHLKLGLLNEFGKKGPISFLILQSRFPESKI